MQKKKGSPVMVIAVIFCSLVFASFTVPSGGDSFEIYLGKNLVMKQNLYQFASARSFSIGAADENQQLDIRYSHCGVVGKGRTITLKNTREQILKKWDFSDAAVRTSGMRIPVKEMLALAKKKRGLHDLLRFEGAS